MLVKRSAALLEFAVDSQPEDGVCHVSGSAYKADLFDRISKATIGKSTYIIPAYDRKPR